VRNYFDFDGGVDNNVPPPPDGSYKVIAEAQDDVGPAGQPFGRSTISEGDCPTLELSAQAGSGGTVYWNTLPYKTAI